MSELGHNRTREEAIEKAAELCLHAIFPEDGELLIDLDGDARVNEAAMDCLTKNGLYVDPDWLITVSKSGGNQHLYLHTKMTGLTNDPPSSYSFISLERVFLQLALGSDPTRELLSYIRILHDADEPTVLFETAHEAERVQNWRADHAGRKANIERIKRQKELEEIGDDVPF